MSDPGKMAQALERALCSERAAVASLVRAARELDHGRNGRKGQFERRLRALSQAVSDYEAKAAKPPIVVRANIYAAAALGHEGSGGRVPPEGVWLLPVPE